MDLNNAIIGDNTTSDEKEESPIIRFRNYVISHRCIIGLFGFYTVVMIAVNVTN